MWRALELENLARVYYLACLAGDPIILSDEEIYKTVERFKSYGPRDN
jgi:L-fuculose-phosphate aldolase